MKESDFRIVETQVPAPKNGQVQLKNLYLSLDPYMRGAINEKRLSADPGS